MAKFVSLRPRFSAQTSDLGEGLVPWLQFVETLKRNSNGKAITVVDGGKAK